MMTSIAKCGDRFLGHGRPQGNGNITFLRGLRLRHSTLGREAGERVEDSVKPGQACCSSETCDFSLIHALRLLGRNCPEPTPARRSASSQGSQTATGRKCQRRAALDGEHAVVR